VTLTIMNPKMSFKDCVCKEDREINPLALEYFLILAHLYIKC